MDEKIITKEGQDALEKYNKCVINNLYYDYRKDPWWGYKVRSLTEREENSLFIYILDVSDMAHDLSVVADDLLEEFSFTFNNISSALQCKDFLYAISTSPIIRPELIDRNKIKEWVYDLSYLEKLSVEIRKKKSEILSLFSPEILAIDKSFFRGVYNKTIGRKEYKKIKKQIDSYYRKDSKLSDDDLFSLSSDMVFYRRKRKEYKEKETLLKLIKNDYYNGYRTDWKRYAEELRPLIENIKENGSEYGKLPLFSLDEWGKTKERLYNYYTSISSILDRYYDSYLLYSSFFDKNVIDEAKVPLGTLEEKTRDAYENKENRGNWEKAISVIKECEKEGVLDFLNSALDNSLSPEEIITLYCQQEKEEKKDESAEEEKKEEKKGELFPLYQYIDINQEANILGVTSFSSPNFSSLVEKILATEAPIYERDLMKSLAFLGGEEYLTRETIERYKEAMKKSEGTSFTLKNGFVYSVCQSSFPFRRTELLRDFSHIAPEELESGLFKLIETYSPIEKSDLYNKLGQYCGYRAVLKSRYLELDRILLLLSDRISIIGDTIKIGESK